MKEFTSLINMIDTLQTEKDCRVFLEQVKWDGIPICPHCGAMDGHYKLNINGEFKGTYKCRDCRKKFTVTIGTMFEGSHIPLKKWFLAIFIFLSHKKGLSSTQLSRDINVTQKTAWFMLGRIRHNLKSHRVHHTNMTQVDETYVGGKNYKKSKYKKVKGTQGRSLKTKTPVMGFYSDTFVTAFVIPNTKKETLQPVIEDLVIPCSTIITDGWGGYKGLNKRYNHKVVNHSTGEYVKDSYHTNGIEGFWSHFKRGLMGIYHQVSPKHLNDYCMEFVFRYNTRIFSDGQRFNYFLTTCIYRLRYSKLIIEQRW